MSLTGFNSKQLLTELRENTMNNISIAAGVNPKWEVENIVGVTTDAPTASFQVLTEANSSGLDVTFPDNAGVTLSFASTDANDNIAGTGARTLLIEGLDVGYVKQFDVVALNGQTPVNSNLVFTRINQLLVLTAGSNEINAGEIYCSDSADTFVLGVPQTRMYQNIAIGFSYSSTATLTLPSDITNCVIGNINLSTNLTSAGQSATIYIESKRPGGAWLRTAILPLVTNNAIATYAIQGTGVYLPKTDIRFRVISTNTNKTVTAYLNLYLNRN